MALVRGDLIEVTGKTVNLFGYPVFGLFFLAMFCPFRHRLSAPSSARFTAPPPPSFSAIGTS